MSTAARNGRGQRQAARPATPPPADFTLLVGSLAQCTRCACLIPDTRPAREQHAGFHQSLRKMWDALGSVS